MEIFGKYYITEKEASQRYGYSVYWFQHQRWLKQGPKFIRGSKNRIFYPLDETDGFFRKKFDLPIG